ncbi:MAG TPA: hypothetical protein VI959_02940 [Alphaproteobacteria bacterium]|nr:hypothetical protein [Alphaproteobacteria bacterium]
MNQKLTRNDFYEDLKKLPFLKSLGAFFLGSQVLLETHATQSQPQEKSQSKQEKASEPPYKDLNTAALDDLYKRELAAHQALLDVLDKLKTASYNSKIKEMCEEHNKRASYYRDLLTQTTGEKPDDSRDLSGVLLGAYATVRKYVGDEKGALKACHTASQNLLQSYDEDLKRYTWPSSVKEKVQSYQEKQRKYVEELELLIR